MQCRTNVFDVGPTSHKCYTNVLCLSGIPRLALAHVECCCPSAAHVFHASHITLLPCSCCSAFSSKLLTMSLLVLAQLYASAVDTSILALHHACCPNADSVPLSGSWLFYLVVDGLFAAADICLQFCRRGRPILTVALAVYHSSLAHHPL